MRTPINKTAALVVGKGITWEPTNKVTTIESDTYLPTRAPLKKELMNKDNFKILTGIVFGRLEVKGLYRDGKGWVCRCSCGRYTVRTAKAITNPSNTEDACEHCDELKY